LVQITSSSLRVDECAPIYLTKISTKKVSKDSQVQQTDLIIRKEDEVEETKRNETEYEPVLFVEKDSTRNESVNTIEIKPDPNNFYEFKQEVLICGIVDLI
jgi:hypothetical protein